MPPQKRKKKIVIKDFRIATDVAWLKNMTYVEILILLGSEKNELKKAETKTGTLTFEYEESK